MKKFLIVLALVSTLASAATMTPIKHIKPIDVATEKLLRADAYYDAQDFTAAAKKDLEVLSMKGLPDEVYASAFILMGNISLSVGRADPAEVAYQRVIMLKAAPARDKKLANLGLAIVAKIRESERKY